ncbi:MAG: chorismate synthase [Clostridia bacterium]|nr:chorismate synthase [Clostridia bacterium]
MLTPYGKNLKIYIEGGSHDEKIELIMDNFPAGMQVDKTALQAFMQRRAPGRDAFSTTRKEADKPVFLSGITNGRTDGNRIHAVIYNSNQYSSDYSFVKDTPRPSHADFCAIQKYGQDVDLRGGGHFSGRLTAMLCVAGALCKQYLREKGIEVFAHIHSIHGIADTPFDLCKVGKTEQDILQNADFPVLDKEQGKKMQNEILDAKQDSDSVGGVIECAVTGLPVGLGEHLFAGAEGRIAAAVFSVPAVKGVEFGNGFGCASLFGSQNNDPFCTDGKKIFTTTNHCGGILGGMTNGMPLVFRAAVKPTPSIAKEQATVSLTEMENTTLKIKGRHDPCIVQRAVPVLEAAAAIAVCDMLLD